MQFRLKKMSPKTPKIWKKYQSGHFEQEAIQETFDAFVFHLNNSPTAKKLQNILFEMAVQIAMPLLRGSIRH